jgi:hypothetical protein
MKFARAGSAFLVVVTAVLTQMHPASGQTLEVHNPGPMQPGKNIAVRQLCRQSLLVRQC